MKENIAKKSLQTSCFYLAKDKPEEDSVYIPVVESNDDQQFKEVFVPYVDKGMILYSVVALSSATKAIAKITGKAAVLTLKFTFRKVLPFVGFLIVEIVKGFVFLVGAILKSSFPVTEDRNWTSKNVNSEKSSININVNSGSVSDININVISK